MLAVQHLPVGSRLPCTRCSLVPAPPSYLLLWHCSGVAPPTSAGPACGASLLCHRATKRCSTTDCCVSYVSAAAPSTAGFLSNATAPLRWPMLPRYPLLWHRLGDTPSAPTCLPCAAALAPHCCHAYVFILCCGSALVMYCQAEPDCPML